VTAHRVEPIAPDTQQIIQLTNALVARIWAHMIARAAELNLSMADAKALQQLQPGVSLPMRALAARVHTNPSNVTVIVGRLEARGLLTREVSADRRVKGVRLTPAGLELRSRLEARIATNHPAVGSLSLADQRTLLRVLQRLSTDQLDADPPPTYPDER
jgi:DNA-binding MarR family transcriptional regulator